MNAKYRETEWYKAAKKRYNEKLKQKRREERIKKGLSEVRVGVLGVSKKDNLKEWNKLYSKLSRDLLTDRYIKARIIHRSYGLIRYKDITPEMIILKRNQLKLIRDVKNKNK